MQLLAFSFIKGMAVTQYNHWFGSSPRRNSRKKTMKIDKISAVMNPTIKISSFLGLAGAGLV
jgi:hypothetical protein